MKEQIIKVGEREFTVRELKYKELTSFSDLEKGAAAEKIMLVSTGMTDEEYDNLSVNEGIQIQKVINELNGLENFQQPPTK